MHKKPSLAFSRKENHEKEFREGFNAFDWNHSGKISYGNLKAAMRRCGHNPTDIEVADIINKIHDDTGSLHFEEFYNILEERTKDTDPETGYKRPQDQEGCITAEEMKFVLMHLPGKITYKEIDEMITTVDKNEDWKISYSEFRVMLGAIPLVMPDCTNIRNRINQQESK